MILLGPWMPVFSWDTGMQLIDVRRTTLNEIIY